MNDLSSNTIQRSTRMRKETMTDEEARQAVIAGLTPRVVEKAIKYHTRRDTALECGHSTSTIGRLAERWGIIEAKAAA